MTNNSLSLNYFIEHVFNVRLYFGWNLSGSYSLFSVKLVALVLIKNCYRLASATFPVIVI